MDEEQRLMNSLEGIRILDLSRLLPGPYATQLLADLGAEVIKVERPPEGDYLRRSPPLLPLNGDTQSVSAVFAQVNRGKQSICLDFGSERGRVLLQHLARRADVFVESFRPGALARRGLGYEALRAVNPGLVYCSLSGYGQTGPYRHRAGHDLNYLALAGILNLNAQHDAAPIPPPVQIADLAGGMLAATHVLAALVERMRTGVGQFLDVALFDGAVSWMQTMLGALYRGQGANPRRGSMPLTGAYPCYNIYETADGAYMSLGALEANFWISFCEAIHRPDLIELQLDPSTIDTLAEIFRSRTRAEWVDLAQHADVCLEPLLEVSEAIQHPQVQARGWARPELRGVPRLGQDTRPRLQEIGCSDADIEALQQAGIVIAE
jgi:alpha-methylacyl-CoA racemase